MLTSQYIFILLFSVTNDDNISNAICNTHKQFFDFYFQKQNS